MRYYEVQENRGVERLVLRQTFLRKMFEIIHMYHF